MKTKQTLLCLYIALLLTSCSHSAPEETSAAVQTENVVQETEPVTETLLLDDVPEMQISEEVHFLMPDLGWTVRHIIAEEQTGDRVNDARYEMKVQMEERFGTTILETVTANTWGINYIRTLVNGGDDTYDACFVIDLFALEYATAGLCYKLEEIPYIDLDKAYWDQSLNQCLTIGGNRYFGFGNYDLSHYDMTYCMIFNKDYVVDLGLESPYTLVDEGRWTLDMFQSMGKTATFDVNGDGVMDTADSFGFDSMAKQVMPCFWIASGELCIDKDENDIPRLNTIGNEKLFTVVDRLYTIMWDEGIWRPADDGLNLAEPLYNAEDKISMFNNNRLLFSGESFGSLESLRDMERDFGIIPFPKYDEKQESYHSRVEGGCSLAIIPVTNQKTEYVGAVLEAMTAFGYNHIVPEYYEVALKTKNSRDSESAEMLDMVFYSRRYDLADTLWCNDIRDGIFRPMFIKNERDLASALAEKESKLVNSIEKAVSILVTEAN